MPPGNSSAKISWKWRSTCSNVSRKRSRILRSMAATTFCSARRLLSRSSICDAMNSRRLLQRLELLHGDRVDRTEVRDLLAQPVRAVLGRPMRLSSALGRERRLERHAEILDDAAHGLVDLHLELALLDAQVGRPTRSCSSISAWTSRTASCASWIVSRSDSESACSKRARSLSLCGPVLGALLQHHVEVVHRLDALPQQLERVLGLARRHARCPRARAART